MAKSSTFWNRLMGLLTKEKYRVLTRHTTLEGAPLDEVIDVAQSILEDRLDRKLEEAMVVDEKAIAYRHRTGIFTIYPERMPVTNVTTSGWEYTNTGIIKSASSGFSIVYNLDYEAMITPDKYEVLISYTGGFTAATAPQMLLLAIARLTKSILDQSTSRYVSGVSSMAVGGVQISYDNINPPEIIPDDVWKIAKGFRRRQYRESVV